MSAGGGGGPSLDSLPAEVIWHDAEQGSYAADLAYWEQLAEQCGGPILDLGAGTGRVSLHLASCGHRVVAVDREPNLLEALSTRARERCLAVDVVCCDARELDLQGEFPLIVAPMQLLHILGGRSGQRAVLRNVTEHLAPGGLFGAAILEEPLAEGPGGPEPIPDVREVDGWIYSSLPIEIRVSPSWVELRRLRQLVAPDGSLTEAPYSIELDRISLAALDRDATAARLQIKRVEHLPGTPVHEDSLVALMEPADA